MPRTLRHLFHRHHMAGPDGYDAPHIQWPGYVSGPQLAALRGLSAAEGMAAVWARLDTEHSSPRWRAANPRLAAELARLGF